MRILIVDDDPSVAELLAEAVRSAGHEALVALDGAEALRMLESTPFDGVFLDVVMPDMGGLVALARIRSRWPTLPVVIMSGHANEDLARQALGLGATDVVRKPAILAGLAQTLDRLRRP
jgi:CheY-like chemotaxis protein